MSEQSPSGRRLAQPSTAYLGDRGEADPQVRALIASADEQLGYLRAVAALCTTRLLMPIVASGDEPPRPVSRQAGAMDGPDPNRHAEMAAVTLTNESGERALLAFTGIDSLQAWRTDARPVLGTLDELAATVGEAGASHLLVDLVGPCQFVLGPDLVAELAQGRRLVELESGEFGWLVVQPTQDASGLAADHASDSPQSGPMG